MHLSPALERSHGFGSGIQILLRRLLVPPRLLASAAGRLRRNGVKYSLEDTDLGECER